MRRAFDGVGPKATRRLYSAVAPRVNGAVGPGASAYSCESGPFSVSSIRGDPLSRQRNAARRPRKLAGGLRRTSQDEPVKGRVTRKAGASVLRIERYHNRTLFADATSHVAANHARYWEEKSGFAARGQGPRVERHVGPPGSRRDFSARLIGRGRSAHERMSEVVGPREASWYVRLCASETSACSARSDDGIFLRTGMIRAGRVACRRS
jgi:hypothetical protein